MSEVGDQQILREILIREIETIHRYQEMLERAGDGDLQRFLAHALHEEKEHVAEALQILRRLDPMQARALDEDHSAHFREGGPGDAALRELLGGPGPDAKPAGAADVAATDGGESPAPRGRVGPHELTVGSLRGN